MDKAIKAGMVFKKSRLRHSPVIVGANWFQFGPGEVAVRERVESRMLLWSRLGKGTLRVNGKLFEFNTNDWIFLPWQHKLTYYADQHDPFLVGGIHLIPDHDPSVPVTFQVAHHARDPLAGHWARRDYPLPPTNALIHGRFSAENDPLAHLAMYVVEKFAASSWGEPLMRVLAELLLAELTAASTAQPASLRLIPNMLRRMQEFVRTRPATSVSVAQLAHIGGCSPASVHRLFREYESSSPAQWISCQRAEIAARLLRSTTLRIHEVAERAGFSDPYHFSRFFKKFMGMSPRAFRSKATPL